MRTRPITILLAVTSLLTACGGGDDTTTSSSGSTPSSGSDALAALGIISKDTTVRAGTKPDFRDGSDGESLRQGDTVRTSATGFAELAYFDGSFTRIDNAAELTLTKLERTDQGRAVNTTLTSGRSWNRVSKATTATDTYTVDTPVATASVRGTAFQIDCTPTTYCRFSVVEGTIALTIAGRDPIVLTAPAQADITKDTARTATRNTVTLTDLLGDPFTTRNLQLDTTKNLPTITTPSTTTSAVTTTTASTTTTTTTTPTTTGSSTATTTPTPTQPPTTAAPPATTAPSTMLDLNGTWNATLQDVRLTAATGCFSGASLNGPADNAYRVQGVGPGCSGTHSASFTVRIDCTEQECAFSGRYRLRVDGSDKVTVSGFPDGCTPLVPDLGSGALTADRRTISFLTKLEQCAGANTYQLVSTMVLIRT